MPTHPKGLEPASRPRRVLVVDDDRDMGESLVALLRLMGHDALYAANPLEALPTAIAFRPEIAFLDLGMPLLDGYALAHKFRSAAELQELPLIALSGRGSPDDYARSRKAGFDAHVRKPIDQQLLESILAQFDRG